MHLFMCKSKIQNGVLTHLNLNYEGSITIDSKILKTANILPHEKVQVLNLNNGNRLETYVIQGKEASREICLNGACARLGYKGDRIIIIAYALCDERELRSYTPKIVFLDQQNNITNQKKSP